MKLGLKYAPDKGLDTLNAFIDTERFIRKLNIKQHFVEKPPFVSAIREPSDYQDSGLKNQSTFNPKKFSSNQFLEVFKSMVEQDIRLIRTKIGCKKGNIQKGLEALEKRKT